MAVEKACVTQLELSISLSVYRWMNAAGKPSADLVRKVACPSGSSAGAVPAGITTERSSCAQVRRFKRTAWAELWPLAWKRKGKGTAADDGCLPEYEKECPPSSKGERGGGRRVFFDVKELPRGFRFCR
nr:hypothetical protein [Halobacillus kuroshimensis]